MGKFFHNKNILINRRERNMLIFLKVKSLQVETASVLYLLSLIVAL